MSPHVPPAGAALGAVLRRLRRLADRAGRPLAGRVGPGPARAEVEMRLRAGRPALRREELEVHLPHVRRRFRELVGAVGGRPFALRGTGDDGVDGLLLSVARGRAWRRAALRLGPGLGPAAARFLALCALGPVFRTHAARARRAGLSTWRRGTCPVCGSPPAIAELRGAEGRRVLRCSLCDAQWTFPRLRCPFCGEADHERLGFFFVDGEGERYRVDHCATCRGYVKTVLARTAPVRRSPLAVDLATLHLDVLARRRGLRRLAPSLLG